MRSRVPEDTQDGKCVCVDGNDWTGLVQKRMEFFLK